MMAQLLPRLCSPYQQLFKRILPRCYQPLGISEIRSRHFNKSPSDTRKVKLKPGGEIPMRKEPATSLIAEMLAGEMYTTEEKLDPDLEAMDQKFKELSNLINQEIVYPEFDGEDDEEAIETLNVAMATEDDYLEEIMLDGDMPPLPIDQNKKRQKKISPAVSSNIPCPGCGARLQCNDNAFPGYISAEKYKVPRIELRQSFCYRCHLMRNYNQALATCVDPSEYAAIISEIHDVRALTILMVDLLDIEGSLIRNLPDLIGRKRPLFIVGNKVDLLPNDGRGYLGHVTDVLEAACRAQGLYSELYVHYTALISAKTGYGIEQLITKLMKFWSRRGHVYLLGSTNVGKSSLFNALLTSDYCKASSKDYIQRATTSLWPGTTLNLLRFPVMAPTEADLARRVTRIVKDKQKFSQEQLLQEKLKNPVQSLIGTTFHGKKDTRLENHHEQIHGYIGSTYSFNTYKGEIKESRLTRSRLRDEVLSEGIGELNESDYPESKWCHDTPGLVNSNQLINLLSEEELSLVLPKIPIRPRNMVVKQGHVVFISGLGRIDYCLDRSLSPTEASSRVIYLTVYASHKVPIHVVHYDKADEFYRQNICTDVLRVPCGSEERLYALPSLVAREYNICGLGWKQPCVDIVLSSLGWVTMTTGHQIEAKLRVYTPGGRGCHVRSPTLLQHGWERKGDRISGSAMYRQPKKKF